MCPLFASLSKYEEDRKKKFQLLPSQCYLDCAIENTVDMDYRKQRLSISEAKNLDIVSYLSSLGFEPSKVKSNDYWYHSPFRNEKNPSFKVNRRLNKWYDHGIGQGGNLIDFAILYHHCTIPELLENLSNHFSFQQPVLHLASSKTERGKQIKILKDSIISSAPLLRYLQQRNIPMSISTQYCREVHYLLHDKVYYGIGFKNDSGGFEIRNPYFKASSSPKGITTFDKGKDQVIVFEGFMDFLSFKTIHEKVSEDIFNFVILNSISLFESARSFMEKHHLISLYLDRDTAGQNCTRYAISLSNRYRDESSLYENYKDFNDWIINFGMSQKKHFTQKQKKI